MLDTTKTRDAHIEERLRADLIVWLGSVRPDGRPHIVPVWFLWEGETVLVFSKPDQKVRNLKENPNVWLALDNTKDGEDVVMVEGKAELMSDPSVNTTLPEYAAKYATQLSDMKWTAETMAQSYTEAIRITPTKFHGYS